MKGPGALEAEAKVRNLWLSWGCSGEELFTQEQQGCSARALQSQPARRGWVSASPSLCCEQGGLKAPPPSSPHWWSRGMQDGGVSLLAGSLWLSWGCWGWSWPWWGSLGFQWSKHSPDSSWEAGALCWPGQGFPIPAKGSLVPPAPAERGFFFLPCRKESPSAIPQLLLPCLGSHLHLQISKSFLGSLFPPSTLHLGICVSFLFISP